MPVFQTPEPIFVRFEAGAGVVRLVAIERADTVVEVRPRDESRPADVWAAEHTRVDFRDGRLNVTGGRRRYSPISRGAIDVEIALPSQSQLHASLGSTDLRAEGEFADVKLTGGSGDVEMDAITERAKVNTASGAFTLRKAQGSISVTTGSGDVRIDELDGDLKFRGASGSLVVERLRGDLKATTASGSVEVAEAVCGSVTASTASGDVAVGVAEGTAVRLDIATASGGVDNELQTADGPEPGDETLTLRVRTASGDVGIRRANAVRDAAGAIEN